MAVRMTAEAWILLALLALLWGASFPFIGVAVSALPPFTVVWLRVALAAAALWLVLAALGRRMPRQRAVWVAFAGMGLLNNAIPFSLIVWGQTQIASGLASILNATTPIFTVLVAHALTADERLTPGKITGAALGFAGVVVMVGADALAGLGGNVAAQLAICGAAVSYAFAGVFGRRFKALGIEPIQTATGQVTASSLLLLPLVLVVDRPWSLPVPGADTVLAILGLAVLSTALAYVLYFRILALAGATNLLLVTFLIPPVAIFLGWAMLDEVLAPRHFAGLALILSGLLAIDGRLHARALLPHRR